ncbi:DNA methyltransferase [Streptomyces olivaceoviridis]|uniref:DNA methyltransferase n=1 Tax=Streptomyces olivaceoviridis TaxID=1921 RepID=UPI003D9F87EB
MAQMASTEREAWSRSSWLRSLPAVPHDPTRSRSTCRLCCSKPGGTVLDPFGGSGTTGAAARQLDR